MLGSGLVLLLTGLVGGEWQVLCGWDILYTYCTLLYWQVEVAGGMYGSRPDPAQSAALPSQPDYYKYEEAGSQAGYIQGGFNFACGRHPACLVCRCRRGWAGAGLSAAEPRLLSPLQLSVRPHRPLPQPDRGGAGGRRTGEPLRPGRALLPRHQGGVQGGPGYRIYSVEPGAFLCKGMKELTTTLRLSSI